MIRRIKKITKLDYIDLISKKRDIRQKTPKFHYLFKLSKDELEQIYLYNLPIINGKGKWQQKRKKEKYSEKEEKVFKLFRQHLLNTQQVNDELKTDSSIWYPKFKIWEIDKYGK